MKIIGKNSLLYWLRIPFVIYAIGFISISLWIFSLMFYYIFTGTTNSFISKSHWRTPNNNSQINSEIIQFQYPFTKMVLATENTTEGITLAFVGLLSICFILFFVMRIVTKLSKDEIFTKDIIGDLKFLGFGLMIFGVITLIIDFTDGFKGNVTRFDLTPPFFYIIIGLILIFLKEIFAKGYKIQEENDLTI